MVQIRTGLVQIKIGVDWPRLELVLLRLELVGLLCCIVKVWSKLEETLQVLLKNLP